MMNLLFVQILSAIGVFFVLMLCGALPFILIRCQSKLSARSAASATKTDSEGAAVKTSVGFLSLCNCFAAGVFVSTCFLGLIPHVRAHAHALRMTLNASETMALSTGMPAAHDHTLLHSFLSLPETDLVVVLGFVLILLLEQLCMSCCAAGGATLEPRHANGRDRVVPTSHDDAESVPLVEPISARNESNDWSINRRESPNWSNHSREENGVRKSVGRTKVVTFDEDDSFKELSSVESDDLNIYTASSGHSHMDGVIDRHSGKLTFRSIALLFGLGIHSAFEGLALGLQDSGDGFMKLLTGVMVHEVLCAVAFGFTLAQQKASLGSGLLALTIVSLTIPVGMAGGLLVPRTPSVATLATRVILEGVAAGTFVYVACVEMLGVELLAGEEDAHGHGHGHGHGVGAPEGNGSRWNGLLKALAVLMGCLAFLCLAVLFN